MQYIKHRKHVPVRRVGAGTLAGGAAASVLATAMLGQPLPAVAQTTQAGGDVSTLSAIKVQGDGGNPYKATQQASPKFTQPLVDTTQTVQVVTQQIMQDQQAATLTDAMKNVAGAGTFYAGENGSTSTGDTIYMRGFDTSNSIYVDGIRDTSSASRDMFNIQEVDVIKGPSGSDYGRSAPSGSISLITKQPDLSDHFDASLGLGTDEYKRSTLDWNRQLGATSAFRLNAMGQKSDVAGRDNVRNERWGVAPSLAFGLGTENRVYLDFLHVKQNNIPDGGVYTIGLPGWQPPGSGYGFMAGAARADTHNFYGTGSDHDYSTTDTGTLRFEHDFTPDTTLRNTTRWSRTTQDYLLGSFTAKGLVDANGVAYGKPGTLVDPADPSTWYMTRNINLTDVDNRILANQTNLTTKFDTGSWHHDLSTGVEFMRETQDNYGRDKPTSYVSIYSPDSVTPAGATPFNGVDTRGTTDTASIYAFDTVDLSDRWQVNGGVRLDNYRTRFDSTTFDATQSGNLFNWKLGALYRLTSNGNIYVNYGVSQQPPGGANFQLASSDTTRNAANRPGMEPQKARTAELGTKWEVFNRRLLVSAALFRTDITNDVETDPDGTVSQSARKRVQGLELGANGQITDNWSVSAGYVFQNATVANGSAVTADGSTNLAYTPRHALSLWSTYELPHGFKLGGGARYVGRMERGTDTAPGTPTYVDAYWVFDAMAGYKVNKTLDFQLNVYNLFNKDYVASINKSGYRYFPGAPRSAMLTANIHF
jgi:catecholate siderophore receptor